MCLLTSMMPQTLIRSTRTIPWTWINQLRNLCDHSNSRRNRKNNLQELVSTRRQNHELPFPLLQRGPRDRAVFGVLPTPVSGDQIVSIDSEDPTQECQHLQPRRQDPYRASTSGILERP